MTRGLRNCNPLNIRRVAGPEWIGQASRQTDRKYVRFDSIEWGIRAACCILRTYARRYKATCVRDIVRRWAPPLENLTEIYIQNVCYWTGFTLNQDLTESDWPRLISAMARQECGVILDEAVVARGFFLYKVF